jgi:hypothetical protein
MSEFGTAEPYVWTAFFKIDGDTVQVDLADDGRPGLFLTGVCTFVATQGSHEDLRDRSVAEGDDAPIPAELGEVRLPLTPMRATQRTGLPADFSVPGTVGVVVAPMSGLEITRVIRRIRFHFAVSPSGWTNEISVS